MDPPWLVEMNLPRAYYATPNDYGVIRDKNGLPIRLVWPLVRGQMAAWGTRPPPRAGELTQSIFHSQTVYVGGQLDAEGRTSGTLVLHADGTGKMDGELFEGTAQIRRIKAGEHVFLAESNGSLGGPLGGPLELAAELTGRGKWTWDPSEYEYKGRLQGEKKGAESWRKLTISSEVEYGRKNGVQLPENGGRLAILHVEGMPGSTNMEELFLYMTGTRAESAVAAPEQVDAPPAQQRDHDARLEGRVDAWFLLNERAGGDRMGDGSGPNPDNEHIKAIGAGVISSLVERLGDPDTRLGVDRILKWLQKLAAFPLYQASVAKAAILPLAVYLEKDDDDASQAAAAIALMMLIPEVIELTRSGSAKDQQVGLRAMRGLAVRADQDAIVKAGALTALCELLDSDVEEVKREANRTLECFKGAHVVSVMRRRTEPRVVDLTTLDDDDSDGDAEPPVQNGLLVAHAKYISDCLRNVKEELAAAKKKAREEVQRAERHGPLFTKILDLIEDMLDDINLNELTGRGKHSATQHRSKIREGGESATLGLVFTGKLSKFGQSKVGQTLMHLLNDLLQIIAPGATHTSVALNKGARFLKHRDEHNDHARPSLIVAFGTRTSGGGLYVWENGEEEEPTLHDIHYKPLLFNGGNLHMTQPWEGGTRFSIVYYTPSSCRNVEFSDDEENDSPSAKRQCTRPAPRDARIGAWVHVYWAGDDEWYLGRITGQRRLASGDIALHVAYEDGDQQHHVFQEEPFAGTGSPTETSDDVVAFRFADPPKARPATRRRR